MSENSKGELRIGDRVWICDKDSRLEAVITGELNDSRTLDFWLVSCPEICLVDGAFYKEAIHEGKHYNFGNLDCWITSYD